MTTGNTHWLRALDRVGGGAALVLLAGWSILYAIAGRLFLWPVSTCGDRAFVCDSRVDLGVALASWGPISVMIVVLGVAVVRVSRSIRIWPVVALGAAAVLGVQFLGQCLVNAGVNRA